MAFAELGLGLKARAILAWDNLTHFHLGIFPANWKVNADLRKMYVSYGGVLETMREHAKSEALSRGPYTPEGRIYARHAGFNQSGRRTSAPQVSKW